MKLTALVGKKSVLLVVCVFVLSPVLLAGCGGETTVEETTVEETTIVEDEQAGAAQEGEAEEQGAVQSADEEGGISPTPSPAPAPAPSPAPAPGPAPAPPVAVQVDCGIGAGGALSCANTAGAPFYCSSSPYGCTDSLGDRYGCEAADTRPGGVTLSCTRLLQ